MKKILASMAMAAMVLFAANAQTPQTNSSCINKAKTECKAENKNCKDCKDCKDGVCKADKKACCKANAADKKACCKAGKVEKKACCKAEKAEKKSCCKAGK